MVTVTFNEMESNAVQAALDERVGKLYRELCDAKEQRDTPDNQFLIACLNDAIRDTMRAARSLANAYVPDYPADMNLTGLAEWVGIEQYQAEGR